MDMFAKYLDKLSLQMYTVHKEVANDIQGAFTRLYDMGYRAIEFYGEQKNFDREIVKRVVKSTGVQMTSWHTEWKDLQPDCFEKTVNYLVDVQCPLVVVPCLGGEWNIAHTPAEECREIWEKYIVWLNELSVKLKKYGMRTGYHNHDHEFTLKYDGKFVFDMLFENLSPDIILEFDSGRAIKAGADPVQVMKKYKDRDILIHLKPYSASRHYEAVLGDPDDLNDIPAILSAYPKDFLWVMVESENLVHDQFTNADLNAKYLIKLFKT
jgi:sugar phosphate isomerase/epimerase